MKKTAIAAALLCLAAGYSVPSSAADPCEVVLCMYGKATGNSGGSECSSAEKDFFDIVKTGKKGSFRADATADARKEFLGECPDAAQESINMIINKFGRIR
ncbi:kikA from plasmid origin [Dickeya oryzae]|uniref:TrbM/KikA/MpfK family conjugal transfer protein n=1 Tax=Dickeya oryzae TaxID=1240404 RepID=UPI001AEC8C9C|nr:TrbM/KikA/MpfK family conjugal transfer protein [Dickeya oryzae]MBP2845823.1 kikA from plasmid origin [Dickeya oryzae]